MSTHIPTALMSVQELAMHVARRARARRLALAWTQQELADRSGMSLSSLRRFERSGAIAFLSLVKIAVALDAVDELVMLFPEQLDSLDQLITKPRQRGRR